MPNILVLVDHTGGTVRKTTAELLTIARRLGEPVAVHLGDGVQEALPALGQYGATKVRVGSRQWTRTRDESGWEWQTVEAGRARTVTVTFAG